ncbi:MAG: AraC family transcriptional regulator, partial [Pyrinomonadaceae bacterium]
MDHRQAQIDRVFIRPQYAISYRRIRRARWMSEPRADYAALFILKGNLSCHIADEPCEISEGEALLLSPGSSASANAREAEFLSLTLSSSFVLDCAIRTHQMATGTSVAFRTSKIARDERLTRLARDLADELKQEEAGQEMVIAALIDQIVVHLLRSYASMKRSAEMELSRVGLVDRRIRRAVELMHAHLNRDLPLEEIASAAHLSPFHFARLFKKLTGASPH